MTQAVCRFCGWQSPECSPGSGFYWTGWHAIYNGCPIGEIVVTEDGGSDG